MKVRAEIVLLSATVLLGSVAAFRWNASGAKDSRPPLTSGDVVMPIRTPAALFEPWARQVTDGNPFRLSRAPSTVPFTGGSPTVAAPAEQIRPSFVVKGIIGPPWMAIIDGLPGAPPGAVVQAGATFDKIIIRRVTRDSLVIQGPDTTWRLGLSRGRP